MEMPSIWEYIRKLGPEAVDLPPHLQSVELSITFARLIKLLLHQGLQQLVQHVAEVI
jgi:hypothetical protein